MKDTMNDVCEAEEQKQNVIFANVRPCVGTSQLQRIMRR